MCEWLLVVLHVLITQPAHFAQDFTDLTELFCWGYGLPIRVHRARFSIVRRPYRMSQSVSQSRKRFLFWKKMKPIEKKPRREKRFEKKKPFEKNWQKKMEKSWKKIWKKNQKRNIKRKKSLIKENENYWIEKAFSKISKKNIWKNKLLKTVFPQKLKTCLKKLFSPKKT